MLLLNAFLDNLTHDVFGTIPASRFISCFFFSFLAIVLSVTIHVLNRDKWSDRSPVPFNFNFMLKDNRIRIVTALIFVFICIRFSQEIFGKQPTVLFAFGISLFIDKTAEAFMNYFKK